jgi:hypothetical protein
MSNNLTLDTLSDYFFNYTKRYQTDTERYEIDEFLSEWLVRIQAPIDARGIMVVLQNIGGYAQDAEVKYHLQKIFHFPDWFFPALQYAHKVDNKIISNAVDNLHMADGWCKSNPFYAWLFSAFKYSKNKNSQLLQLFFIELYYARLSILQDDELRTPTQTREQEVCSAARLLFDRKNSDMARFVQQIRPDLLADPELLARKIDVYCKDTSPSIEQKNVNYLHSLMHFLLEDWTPGGLRNTSGRFKRRVARRYNKIRYAPLQGNDNDLVDILPALSEQMSSDGLEPDDMYPAQDFALEDNDCEKLRDKRETTSPARVVDPRIQRRKAIDVTAKVRRGQNVVLQNTELLKGAELARFICYLQERAKHPHQAERAMALICWLMLLLGKTYDDITDLSVFDELEASTSGLYLDKKGNGWWCFPMAYSAKPHLDDVAKGLIQTQEFVFTPCSDFLLPMIRNGYSGGLKPLLNQSMVAEILQRRLKTYSDKVIEGGRITTDKLSNFMQRYCFASGCIDPVVLDFSYRLALTQTRVSRSYACLDDNVRQDALFRLWNAVGLEINAADPDVQVPQLFEPRAWAHNHSVGSIFTPSLETCKRLQSALMSRLEGRKPARTYSYDSVIRYHNRYVLYTAYLLMFATGYRAVHNPLPSLSLHLKTYGLLAISDKDDADFTHARLVCVPSLLAQQLNYYEEHLTLLAEFIRYRLPDLAQTIDHILRQDELMLMQHPTEAAAWYKKIKNSRTILGPLFLFRKQNDQWVPINIAPKDLIKDQPDNLQLPANAGRHWLKSELIKRKVDPEWIDWQMGHWMTGQAPLAYYSALSHVEVSALLGEIIDELLKEVGWKSLPSALT